MKVSFFVPARGARAQNQYSAPLGLGYLSSYLKKYQDISAVDLHVDLDELIAGKPDIIGMTAFSQDYSQAIYYAEKIKKRISVPIVIGGYHISALPKSLNKNFLAGIVGEGEETFAELISLLQKDKLDEQNLSKVRGLVFRQENGELFFTEKRPLIKDLDIIPPPDRNLFHTARLPWGKSSSYQVPIYSSRGCPFRCIFCIHSELKSNVRNFSIERVISEIEYIVENYPKPTTICFFDDLFALNKKRLAELANAVISRGLHRQASFACTARASVFNEEICEIFKEMNLNSVAFGMESGVDQVIQYLKGTSAKVAENKRALELCRRYDFMCHGYFIIGSPPETMLDLAKTYWFMRTNQPPFTSVNVYSLVPFPGTRFWQEALEKKLVSEDLPDWSILNFENFQAGKTLFMNGFYSAEEYQFAYDHFQIFKQKNEQQRVTVMAKEKLKEQLADVAKKFANYLQNFANGSVLEFSNYPSGLVELMKETKVFNYLPEEKSIFTSIEDESLQAVLFNYSLNSSKNWEKTLTEILPKVKTGGLIGISFFNLLFSHIFISMLQGSWNNIQNYGTVLDNLSFITCISLEKFSKNRKDLQIIAKLPNKVGSEIIGNTDFIDYLAGAFKSSSLYENKDVASFLFVLQKIQ